MTQRTATVNRTLVLLAVVACNTASSADQTHQSAGDPTPIRYLYCDALGNKCQVVARFKDRDTCERFKEIDIARCDRVSVPNKIVCDTRHESTRSTAFCTR